MPGLYFEEFEEGMVFDHLARRTITESDNMLFCGMTLNLAPLHIDAAYAATTMYGEPLVNSLLVLGLVTGICMHDTTHGTTLGNLGFEDVKFTHPVLHGDTIHVRTEVLSKRESQSRTDSGIVFFSHTGINQRDEVVCTCKRAGLMLKRPVAKTA